MKHKTAVKRLMGVGFDRNTADMELRDWGRFGHPNRETVEALESMRGVQRLMSRWNDPWRNRCEFRSDL